jgi:hypothetical protein
MAAITMALALIRWTTDKPLWVANPMAVLLAGSGAIVGTIWLISLSKASDKIRKYEFEHRTSAGVVEFESYEAAKKHRYEESLIGARISVAGLLIACSLIALCVLFFA